MKPAVLLLLLTLGACMSAPPRSPSPPSPVAVPPGPPTATPALPEPPLPAPAIPPAPARPPTSEATDALIRASDEATRRGDLRGAIATLERAIRIDGRNAELWARLSSACLREGRVNLARQYASRAHALAANRPDWKRAAALATAAIEEQVGNYAEAERIRALYRQQD